MVVFRFVLVSWVACFGGAAMAAEAEVTTTGLLGEMTDLAALSRFPAPGYRTVQYSSFDRRSTSAEAPGWFSNSDGFGREPVPGFEAVLREPDSTGVGLYLLADVKGPGTIVRGWSAGMGGTLRVFLDGAETPIWNAGAYDFLARRSGHYLAEGGVDVDAGDAFSQQDADYFPIAFARGLRVTWEGKVAELHFYHLQVRLYDEGTRVRTFDPKRDVAEAASVIREVIARLTAPGSRYPGQSFPLEARLASGAAWDWKPEWKGAGAVTELSLRLVADGRDAALRGVRLRLAFDGAERHQVDAPVGDFFGSGPGVNPYESLPFTVRPDGTMICRYVMPFAGGVSLQLENFTGEPVEMQGSVKISPWTWDDSSLYFRAKWRVDHDLLAGVGVIDLPYAVVIGRGVFAGCAAQIMNPSAIPTAYGNWWGEGDEKIVVDGEATPSTFGTGSEDYFNYSWSRPDLFDHPYCGQPLDSGPDCSGYVSNHRFQILDAIPFKSSLAVYLELFSHRPTPGLSYGRIAYHYARPGAVDDHRALMPSELKVPVLPERVPVADAGSAGAVVLLFEDLERKASAGTVERAPTDIATRKSVVLWKAEVGATLDVSLPIQETAECALHLVALHSPQGATVRCFLDGKPLARQGGGDRIALTTNHVCRNLNVHLERVRLEKGTRRLTIECVEPGEVGLDYLWVK